jgi:nucleotide-binding universal stress UspA family protein
MAYAAIMVGVGQDAASDARVALARKLASRFEASLIGVAAEAPITTAVHDGGTAIQAEFIEHATRRLKARLADAERRFHAALPLAANKVEWRSFIDHPGEVLAREARAADLMVVGTGGTIDAGDVLMQAGRPVLVVPAGIDLLLSRQVVIGWRDTPQSRRAVCDALPLLRRAEGALVLGVIEQPDPAAAHAAEAAVADIIVFLARHGVSADGEVRPLRQDSVAEELVRAAEERGADLIVSGAYGHARSLEWALGGVTRALLTRCPMCCLMSH